MYEVMPWLNTGKPVDCKGNLIVDHMLNTIRFESTRVMRGEMHSRVGMVPRPTDSKPI